MNEKFLKSLLPEDTQVGDLILARKDLIALDGGYQEFGVETPEWVTDQLDKVSKEIVNRNRVELQRKLKAAIARRATLATAEEKRNKLDEEIQALTSKLA